MNGCIVCEKTSTDQVRLRSQIFEILKENTEQSSFDFFVFIFIWGATV